MRIIKLTYTEFAYLEQALKPRGAAWEQKIIDGEEFIIPTHVANDKFAFRRVSEKDL